MSPLAKAGRYALALFLALVCLCLYMAMSFIAYYAMEFAGLDTDIHEGLYSFISAVLVIICFLIYNRFSSKDKTKRFIKTRKISAFEVLLLVIIGLGLIGFVTSYLSVFVIVSDYLQPVQQEVANYDASVDRYAVVEENVVPFWDSCLYMITMAFFVPLSEEMVFRGALFGHLERAFKPWVAVLIAAALFGALHGMSIHIGYALVCGIIITFCYYYTGSIISSVLLHSLFNLIGSAVPFFLKLEVFGIPEDTRITINATMNLITILAMVPAVFAFITLVKYSRNRIKSESDKNEEVMVTEVAAADE